MTQEINVTPTEDAGSQLAFVVRVGEHEYRVTVAKDYDQKLTEGKIPLEELVRSSFEFLLEREPASSILPEFDLPLIGRYFPEYEGTMQQRIAS